MPYRDPLKAKEYRQKRYSDNRELLIKKTSDWQKANKDKRKETSKKYVENNRDKRIETVSRNNIKSVERKRQWYINWRNSIGGRSWDQFCKERSENKVSGNYPAGFNSKLKKLIKDRDNNCCKLCGISGPLSREVFGRSLAVHHIDYNKENLDYNNLTTTCIACNASVNANKEYWQVYFGNKTPKVCVVIPTIRTDRINAFLVAWEQELSNYDIIIIEDNATKQCEITAKGYKSIRHLCHEDIRNDLGENEWVISKKTSAVCSYGFWKAWKLGYDVTVKLDDDILVRDDGFIKKHLEMIYTPRPLYWVNTFVGGYARGFPYKERVHPTVFNYGLAEKVLDYDAQTQLLGKTCSLNTMLESLPYGTLAPICGMNIAFLTKITPALYFGYQGMEIVGFDRFDDIWAGLFLKKVTDSMKTVISVGNPICTHTRLSSIDVNFSKEALGMSINEDLYEFLHGYNLKRQFSYVTAFRLLANAVRLKDKNYQNKLKKAMLTWVSLFE